MDEKCTLECIERAMLIEIRSQTVAASRHIQIWINCIMWRCSSWGAVSRQAEIMAKICNSTVNSIISAMNFTCSGSRNVERCNAYCLSRIGICGMCACIWANAHKNSIAGARLIEFVPHFRSNDIGFHHSIERQQKNRVVRWLSVGIEDFFFSTFRVKCITFFPTTFYLSLSP